MKCPKLLTEVMCLVEKRPCTWRFVSVIEKAVEMLMSAGADWSLQNEQGWSALQEAVCAREEEITVIITRHYQPMAWAKWCRRLPRLSATMHHMRDFYMEITFHFESSVIPFIVRIAPSDTYRIWKRGGEAIS
ncbi:unnamed protein product [Sphagnum balticum]